MGNYIWAIGSLNNNVREQQLVLLTTNEFIYEFRPNALINYPDDYDYKHDSLDLDSNSNINNTKEQKQTQNNARLILIKPKLLKDKWPTLSINPMFRRHQQLGSIQNVILIQNHSNHDYFNETPKSQMMIIFVVFEPKIYDIAQPPPNILSSSRRPRSSGHVTTFVYDINSRHVSPMIWTYDDDLKHSDLEGIEGHASIWIGNDDSGNSSNFFVLLPDRYGGLVMAEVRAVTNESRFEQIGNLYRVCLYSGGDSIGQSFKYFSSSYNDDNAEYNNDPDRFIYGIYFIQGYGIMCVTPWNRPITTGLHHNGRFYLFGRNDIIYSFNDQVMITLNKPYPLIKQQYNEFFHCSNNMINVHDNMKIKASRQGLSSLLGRSSIINNKLSKNRKILNLISFGTGKLSLMW